MPLCPYTKKTVKGKPDEPPFLITNDNDWQTDFHFILHLVSSLVMQSFIETSGYGYRKRVCEDVTVWFLDRFLPRHRLDVRIVHRGLKRELVYGWCDFEDDYKRPRSFLIELQVFMSEEQYIQTLLHELVHLRQWVLGNLCQKRGKMYYGPHKIEDYDYEDQPHEIEAREQEKVLYLEYLQDRDIVPVSQVVHGFPNRLLNVV